MNPHLARAGVLIEQHRYDRAEQELRGALAADPDDPLAHALLSVCLREQKKLDEALQSARTSIRCAPDAPLGHQVLADACLARHRHDEARQAIDQAISLDPADADSWATLAAIHLAQRRRPEALEAADRGLRHDPEHLGCINLRAMALVALGRKKEAGETVGFALRKDPENAVSHANTGWTCLHRGDHRAALEHFREALRLDPQLDWARQGLVEALKARYVVYRWLLAYFLWSSRLSRKGAWAVVILSYLGFRALRVSARDLPEWRPVLVPLVVVAGLALLLTWIGAPFFNLLLRCNRFGRYALDDRDKRASTWLAILLGAAAGLGVLYWATGQSTLILPIVATAVMTIPVTHTLAIEEERRRRRMLRFTAVLVLLGGAGVVAGALGLEAATIALLLPFFLGAIGFQWVVTWTAIQR